MNFYEPQHSLLSDRPPTLPAITTETMRRRRVGSSLHSEDEPWIKRLPRPTSRSINHARALIDKVDLTDKDIQDFLHGRSTLAPYEKSADEKAFADRRQQIREWAAQVEHGGAHIDADERLVPNAGRQPLPPIDPNRIPPNPMMDNEDQERRWLERERQEATEAISRAVQRYREQGVPEEEFELIQIPLRGEFQSLLETIHAVVLNASCTEQTVANLTLRRICFAVLAVVAAFVCIMLQTLPLLQPVRVSNPVFDPLMKEVLHIREFEEHAIHCEGLHRNGSSTIDAVSGISELEFHSGVKRGSHGLETDDGTVQSN